MIEQIFTLDPHLYPLNMTQWILGAIAMSVFGYRAWIIWRRSGSRLSRFYWWFGAAIAGALVCYSLAGLPVFTAKAALTIMVIGDIAFYVGLVVHTRILGELLPDQPTAIRFLTGVITVAAIISLVVSWLFGRMVTVDAFLYYDVPALVLIIRSVGEACIFIPTAWAFFRRARNVHIASDALKAYVISAAYLGVALGALHRDLILRGVETPWHVASNIVLFGVLLATILVVNPPGRHYAQQATTTN